MTSCTECSSDIIDRQSFACYDESPKHVTYRARLEGTSEMDSGSLISLIEQWVRGGASIIVTGVLMTVDSECSVAISSLSEGECSPTQPPPDTDPTPSSTTTTPTDPTTTVLGIPDPSVEVTVNEEGGTTDKNSSSNTTTIIGGVVAVIIVLIIAITIVAIIALILKSRRGEITLKNAEKYVSEMHTFLLILVFSL